MTSWDFIWTDNEIEILIHFTWLHYTWKDWRANCDLTNRREQRIHNSKVLICKSKLRRWFYLSRMKLNSYSALIILMDRVNSGRLYGWSLNDKWRANCWRDDILQSTRLGSIRTILVTNFWWMPWSTWWELLYWHWL